MPLDLLVKRLNLDRVNFIKIDVEGAEHMLLEGAKETLQLYNVRLAIEAGHDDNIRKKCMNFLGELGYRIKKEGVHYAFLTG